MKKTIILCLLLLLAATSAQAVQVQNPAAGFFADWGNNTFQGVMIKIIHILLGLTGLISMLFLIIGGFQYITSGANADLAEQGKKTVRNAIIGLVIVILSYIIVVVVVNTLF